MVQQASFLMLSLPLVSSCRRQGSAPQLMTTCVCTSLPVTILPTARSAAATTFGTEHLNIISTSIMLIRYISLPTFIQVLFFSNNFTQRRRSRPHMPGNDTYVSSSTSRLQIPQSTTACILSLEPSHRYDTAQQASVSTSLSW